MALPGIWSRVTGGLVGLAGARAASDAVTPVFETTKQRAWGRRAVRVLDPATAAEALAHGLESDAHLAEDAKRHGVGATRFHILTQLAYTFPGLAELDDLTNRGIINTTQADAVLERLGYPDPWRARLIALFQDKLSPATVANAVQQGHMPNDGVLPQIDPTVIFPPGYRQPTAPDDAPPSSVPLTTIPIHPIPEAAAAGIDEDRLKVEANLSGLPPGPEALLAMWNRNLIDQDSVDAGIREGHMKTKWAHAFKRMRWAVLSAPEYAGLWLRGWITKAEAIEGGALTGTTPEQMDLLYKNRGRPLAPVQAFTAWARKARHPVGEGIPARPGTFDFTDFKRAIQQSDIRTEYVEPLWDIRFAYPPLFQTNRLVTSGAIDPTLGVDWLEKQRYAPEVIAAFTAFWGNGATAAPDPLVKSASTYVLTRIRNVYVQERASEAEARTWLGELGITAATQDGLIQVWNVARQVPGAGLTRAQLKKAFKELPTQWPRDRTLSELEALGMEPEEAQTYLDE